MSTPLFPTTLSVSSHRETPKIIFVLVISHHIASVLPNHQVIYHAEDSISGPLYQNGVQMEVQHQDPNVEMAFAHSNHARMEPVSPVCQMPFRSQYHESPVRTNACVVPDPVEMEVESPLGLDSPGLQNQSPFAAVASPIANPGGMDVGCLGYHIPGSPPRVLTPSPVRDITRRIQQMDGPSGRVGVATPPSVAAGHALRATPSPLMLALGELKEFVRIFLIYVYHGE